MPRIYLLCLGVILSLLLSMCTATTPIPLHQDLEDVSKIEILDTRGCSIYTENPTVLYELQSSEYSDFWKKLSEIKVSIYFTHPDTSYGNYSIRIYYNDGCIETLGDWLSTYYQPGVDSLFPDTPYYIDDSENFMTLLEEYIALPTE